MGREEILTRFMALFDGIGRAYGTYDITGPSAGKKGKMAGKAITVRAPVTSELFSAHLSGQRGIGIPPLKDDGTVKFGAIDIDVYEGLDHAALEARSIELGFPLVFCRTKSGGIHAYLFLTEPASAKVVRDKLVSWAAALGHGGVEVFPKQVQLASETDVGNWINLPYFNARDTQRPGIHMGEPMDLRNWIVWADDHRVTPDQLDDLTLPEHELIEGAPPCLQTLARSGFPPGTRNSGLFNLGVFARMKYQDEWKDRMDDFNRAFMSPPLPSDEVVGIAKHVGRKEYFYTCNQPPIQQYCDKEGCRQCKHGIGDGSRTAHLDSLTKLVTADQELVGWVATVDGCRVEVTTDDIMNQPRFRKVCFERLNKLPKLMTPAAFERMIAEAIDRVEEMLAPTDAGPEGQFIYHLQAFVLDRPPARTREELLMGKPWFDNNRVYFRSADLLKYLDQQHFKMFTPQKVYTTLRKTQGIEHEQMNLNNKCVQVWSIPAPARQNAPIATPTMNDFGSEF